MQRGDVGMTYAARLALTLLISSIDSACEILLHEDSDWEPLRHQLGALRINLSNLRRDLEYPEVE